jgi:hypothetical protein
MVDRVAIVYRSFMEDSARWERFRFREGDIVVTTPRKSGTTWTQTLCALLIFDGDRFPAPLSRLSPWLDQRVAPIEDVLAVYESQRHRRIIKTHTPLDGLPVVDGAVYITAGRDPRDVMLSMDRHRANMDFEGVGAVIRAANPGEDVPEPPGYRSMPFDELFQSFVDGLDPTAPVTLQSVMHHLETAWQRRHEPNIVMFHYADYTADLPAELRRLARALGVPLTADRAAQLAPLAGFDAVRRRAGDIAPNADIPMWKDTGSFFRAGRIGEWRERCSPEQLRHYEAVVAASFDPSLAAWAHGGRSGSGIDPNVGRLD